MQESGAGRSSRRGVGSELALLAHRGSSSKPASSRASHLDLHPVQSSGDLNDNVIAMTAIGSLNLSINKHPSKSCSGVEIGEVKLLSLCAPCRTRNTMHYLS
jgi:hypothetical protein